VRRLQDLLALTVVAVVASIASSYMVSGPAAPLVEYEDAAIVLATGQVLTMYLVALAAGFIAVVREAERGTLEGLRSSPVHPEAVFLAKTLYIAALVLGLSLVYASATTFFSNWNLLTPLYLAHVAVVALFLSAASALTSFMIVYSESRSLLAVTVLAGLVIPYLQQALHPLGYAAAGVADAGSLVELSAAAAAFTAVATVLSKPLAEI
jgi:heme exporter protein B